MPGPPVSYVIDDARQIVEVTVREGATSLDVLAYFNVLRQDARMRPDYDRLAVYDAADVHFTPAEIRAMVDAAAYVPHSPGTRVAIVVHSDVLFGMMRMYEIYSDARGLTVQVFRKRGDALDWLAQHSRRAH